MNDSTAGHQRWPISVFVLTCLPVAIILIKLVFDQQQVHKKLSCEQLLPIFEAFDRDSSFNPRSTLLLGGERVMPLGKNPAFWGRSAPTIRSHPHLKLASIEDCFERAIAYYRPNTVIFWLEDQVIDEPVENVTRALLTVREQADFYGVAPTIHIVLPPLTPARVKDKGKYRSFAATLTEWQRSKPGLNTIDLSDALAGGSEQPQAAIFWPDGKRLNVEGYKRVTALLLTSINSKDI